VRGVDTFPVHFTAINTESCEVFKICGGKIHEIEVVGFALPYNSKKGWE